MSDTPICDHGKAKALCYDCPEEEIATLRAEVERLKSAIMVSNAQDGAPKCPKCGMFQHHQYVECDGVIPATEDVEPGE